jgi:hypothetical protein
MLNFINREKRREEKPCDIASSSAILNPASKIKPPVSKEGLQSICNRQKSHMQSKNLLVDFFPGCIVVLYSYA